MDPIDERNCMHSRFCASTELNTMHTEPKYLFAHSVAQLSAGSQARLYTPPHDVSGFTLVELMITLVVAAILITIAVPSFNYTMVSNQLSSTANDLISALSTARASAIKLNTDVDICADNTCSVTTSTGATSLRSGITGITGSIQIQNVTHLIYNGQGLAHDSASTATTLYNGLVADIFSNAISSNNHRCIYMATGSVLQTCTVTSNGACSNALPANCN